ncbi:hypothetical protein KFE98_07370 [bacterium SCSIO 12741]|nr:hypothetical protein KFE98_07370 [bacterium SCSIO 12741]
MTYSKTRTDVRILPQMEHMKALKWMGCAMILLLTTSPLIAQKKKLTIKKPNLRIGEKIGNLAGNMMTAKTDDLGATAPIVTLIMGVYPVETKTSESKYFPKNTREGDHLVYTTFMKSEGMGMYKILGNVSCEGDSLDYVGVGSYGLNFDKPVEGPKKVDITTETGGKATVTVEPIPEVEILEINGDPTMPILDLNEDFTLKISHPEGAEGTTIKVGLLTDVAGARAWNYFADFKATDKVITIPKESFSSLEINGKLGAGQVNKGLNYLVVLRQKITEYGETTPEQASGDCGKVKIQVQAYGAKPVIVKGKQEEGVITELKFSGRARKKYAYSIYKPNARTGIPFSRASNFGLASLTINGRTYKKESKSGTNTWTVGDTRYTQTWTRTTTYEFPQLPDEYWETAMESFYQSWEKMMAEKFSIKHVPVETITSDPVYTEFFPITEQNTKTRISKNYKNTKRVSPESLREIMKTLNDDSFGELMKSTRVDGMVSLEINFDIGANRDNNIVLLPKVKFSIQGIDETKENRRGVYAEGFITLSTGVPFSSEALEGNPEYLSHILNLEELMASISYMFDALRQKEVEMGYDKIWNIGE